jgi:hypothetical protein
MDFTGINFTNVYFGLDNVVLLFQPIQAGSTIDREEAMREGVKRDEPKSLLIASHYDSAVCSHGEF